MTAKEAVVALLALQVAVIAAAVVFAIRVYGRLAKLEEWARLMEKRVNGLP